MASGEARPESVASEEVVSQLGRREERGPPGAELRRTRDSLQPAGLARGQ